MSKLHRLFHLTRVTEYLPPAEPIHRGKCFGEICSYHLFPAAVGLKSKTKTVLEEGKPCPNPSHRTCVPRIDVCHSFLLDGPSEVAAAQAVKIPTSPKKLQPVSTVSSRLSETTGIKIPRPELREISHLTQRTQLRCSVEHPKSHRASRDTLLHCREVSSGLTSSSANL